MLNYEKLFMIPIIPKHYKLTKHIFILYTYKFQ